MWKFCCFVENVISGHAHTKVQINQSQGQHRSCLGAAGAGRLFYQHQGVVWLPLPSGAGSGQVTETTVLRVPPPSCSSPSLLPSRYCGAAALKVSHPASGALRFCDEDLAFKWLLFYFQGNIFCFFSLSISYLKMSISKEKYNLFFLSLSLCIHGQRTNFLGILFLYRLGLLVHLFSQFCRTVLGIQGQMILSNQQKWDKRDNPIQH